ncbi:MULTISPECIES: Nramp family divalent metal transporter [Caballeronia]|uniref:Divalent metal cation transporter MntH n=1 Tax=Caballeronia zhejiangensis TaxID=871203 RepID=A0A656QMT1_9BURK|nr:MULTISPECIES: Nramp family divalent metal transporter [Caballeronia]EKS69387.1 metal ion transporter [Burkholderia sp. SJ98]KDR29743.1 manganese transporter [Caballeronia zhejiangensis]MDR5791068.1 Nramp family divalent metal transporter [Caballeronia sp. LP003]
MLDPVRPASKPPEQDDAFRPSLPEVYASVHVPETGRWIRRFLAFAGPGYMISVGYMDPGNWATDIAGGSRFGYTLLAVILLSNLMAILLQALAVRLGVATGRDLAQACRDHYSKPVNFALWLACEAAIVACDLAEVIGTAIALQLLFGIPLIAGALLTALDAFLLLLLINKGFRLLEAFVIALLVVIASCFALQIAAAAPPFAEVLRGFIPSPRIVADREMLYVAIGILGATVMPHNLYLHSSIVQTRAYGKSVTARRAAIRWATIDSTIALTLALFINAAILIVAAAVFHANGHDEVAEIGDAFRLLSPLLGLSIASTLFAVALLASGLNSTVTATLAGQIVMEGFLRLRIPNWARRLITRAIAIVPVIVVTAIYGEKGTGQLLVLSQVILSMQLPFAVIPLVRFVSDRRKMGVFAISRWTSALAWLVAAVIVALNVKLLADTLTS